MTLSIFDAIAAAAGMAIDHVQERSLVIDSETGAPIGRTFMNAVSGANVPGRDKSAAWTVNVAQMLTTDPERTALFHRDYMARRIVSIIPSQALKYPYRFVSKTKPKIGERLTQDLEPFRSRAKEAWIWANNYGGCVVVLGLSGKSEDPAQPNEVPQWFEVVDRRYVNTNTFGNEPSEEGYGRPLTWNVSNPLGIQTVSRVFHKSRLIFFPGIMTSEDVSAAIGFWQISLHDLIIQALADYHGAWANANHLLASAHQGVFKIKGFSQMVASQNRELALARLQIVDIYRSILRSIVVDADDEDFEYKTAPLTGAPELMREYREMISSAARVPLTVLHGSSPAGMNATGESDLRIFADTTNEERENYLNPILLQIARRYALSYGEEGLPIDLKIEHAPVWQSTPKEKAEIATQRAASDKLLIDSQQYLPEEVAIYRTANGYETDMALTPEGTKAREKALSDLYGPKPDEVDASGKPIEGADPGVVETEGGVPIELAPTTIAMILSANEARKQLGEGPALLPDGTPDPDGNLPIAAYDAKKKADVAPKPAPAPFGGAPPAAKEETEDEDEQTE